MTPLRLHVPDDRPTRVSHMICGEPLGRSSRFSLPAAKNAKEPPSGDQNAESTSSVPGSAAGVSESRDRSHSCLPPSGPTPTNTNRSPFGERAIESKSGVAKLSGGEI